MFEVLVVIDVVIHGFVGNSSVIQVKMAVIWLEMLWIVVDWTVVMFFGAISVEIPLSLAVIWL